MHLKIKEIPRLHPAELVTMLEMPENPDPWVEKFICDMRAQREKQGEKMWCTLKQIKKLRELVGRKKLRKIERAREIQRRGG